MNNFSIKYPEEIYMKVLSFLGEVQGQAASLSWREALVNLKKYLNIKKTDKAFMPAFGQFAIQADDFWLLEKGQLETARKYLKKIRGCKVYVRIMPDVNLGKREWYAFAEPGMVLWELSGITGETAMQIACELRQLLGMPLTVR